MTYQRRSVHIHVGLLGGIPSNMYVTWTVFTIYFKTYQIKMYEHQKYVHMREYIFKIK